MCSHKAVSERGIAGLLLNLPSTQLQTSLSTQLVFTQFVNPAGVVGISMCSPWLVGMELALDKERKRGTGQACHRQSGPYRVKLATTQNSSRCLRNLLWILEKKFYLICTDYAVCHERNQKLFQKFIQVGSKVSMPGSQCINHQVRVLFSLCRFSFGAS